MRCGASPIPSSPRGCRSTNEPRKRKLPHHPQTHHKANSSVTPIPAKPQITSEYLAKAERDAQKFKGPLAPYVTTLAAEVRRARLPVPPPTPPLVAVLNRRTTAMLRGNPATDRMVYTTQDAYAQKFVRNPSCWLAGVSNLTCFSPAQMSGTPWHLRAGTLVTTRHIVYATHFGIPVIEGGTPVLFVTLDGTVVQRKLVAQKSDPPTDISVGLLDAEVPPTIDIAPVLPADYEAHLGSRHPLLVATLDAEEKANVQQINTFFAGGFTTNTLHEQYVAPEFKAKAAWSEATVVGDSGNPTFAVIDNTLVLIGCFWTAMGGTNIGAKHDLVNGMIGQLAAGYRLTTKEL